MSQHNTDTVNVFVKNNTYTDNVTDGDKYKKSKEVELVAMQLVDKFNTPSWFPFYCKVAYKLPQDLIWRLYEQAHGKKVRDPAKLFYYLCDRAMSMR